MPGAWGTSLFVHLGVKYLALSLHVYGMTAENYENNGQLYAYDRREGSIPAKVNNVVILRRVL